MKRLLGSSYDEFLRSYSLSPSRALAVNRNKISVEKFAKLFPYSTRPVPYADEGLYFDTDVKLGRTPLHHAGAFYLQEPSAMLPVAAAEIPRDATVLDLCAAPGGKSIMLAKRLGEGFLVSNEINSARARVLYSNVERMGLKNVAITNNAPRDFSKFKRCFDVVLVDAPCSGEGMFRKDAEAIRQWSEASVKGCALRQSEILEDIADCVKPGGLLIYSTCTFSEEENEGVVLNFLKSHGEYSTEECNSIVKPYVVESTSRFYRAYPHISGGEGQFFALLRRSRAQSMAGCGRASVKANKSAKTNAAKAFLDSVGVMTEIILDGNRAYTGFPMELSGLRTLTSGVYLGETEKNLFRPSHYFFTAFGNEMNSKFSPSREALDRYLRGEELACDNSNGYVAVIYEGMTLGGGKAVDGRLKNLYPKGLRNFK